MDINTLTPANGNKIHALVKIMMAAQSLSISPCPVWTAMLKGSRFASSLSREKVNPTSKPCWFWDFSPWQEFGIRGRLQLPLPWWDQPQGQGRLTPFLLDVLRDQWDTSISVEWQLSRSSFVYHSQLTFIYIPQSWGVQDSAFANILLEPSITTSVWSGRAHFKDVWSPQGAAGFLSFFISTCQLSSHFWLLDLLLFPGRNICAGQCWADLVASWVIFQWHNISPF